MADIHGVKGDAYQMAIVAKYEMYKALRSKKVYIFLAFIAILFVLSTVLQIWVQDGMPDNSKDVLNVYISSISFVAIIGATLFSSTALVSEFEERTALLMFTRPLRKVTIFLGKYVSNVIFCGAMVGLYYVIAAVMSLIYTGTVDAGILSSFGMAIFYVAAISALAFVFSSFMKRGSSAAVLTFVAFLLMAMVLGPTLMFSGVEPVMLLTYVDTAVSSLITGDVTMLITEDDIGIPGVSFMNYIATAPIAVGICAVYIVVSLVASYLVFSRREF
jgi:hypothetical protein